jgi:hypothetical protein
MLDVVSACLNWSGAYAGWVLEFCLPLPMRIENVLMKLKLKINIAGPAQIDDCHYNWMKHSL